jgi:stage V sporulation protein B
LSEAKKQNYLHGATILAAGVVIMKILGAIYKIPLGNILGDEGYAYFFAAYSIYTIFLTLSTAGLPVALSRLISEANELGRPMQARKTFRVAFATFFVVGIVCTLVMYFYPNELAAMIGKPQIAQSLWAISPAVFLVCLTSAYRGYCQGRQNMTPTTVGQVLEVLVKVIFGLILAWYLVRAGKSLPIASAGAISGVTVGSLAALGYMYTYKRRFYPERAIAAADTPDSSYRILRRIIRIGVPITLGASVLNLINFIDTALVINRLQSAAGFSDYDSSVLFGVYGKAQTLYNLPASIITPLCISVVPAIAACMARCSRVEASRIAENSLRISVVLALPMGTGLSVLAYPIMNGIYPGSNAAGPELLTLLGVASFFVCLALMQNAILQAHGNELYTVLSMVAGGVVKVGINWVLVADPAINITGAPIGTLCCYAVICVMNYLFLSKCLKNKPRLGHILLRPLLSSLVMGAGAWAVYGFAIRFLSGGTAPGVWTIRLALLAAVGVGVLLYLIMVVLTRAVTREDMMLIPKGDKLARILHIR